MGANDDIDATVFQGIELVFELFCLAGVCVEPAYAGVREQAVQLVYDRLCANRLEDYVCFAAIWAATRQGLRAAADMTAYAVRVSVVGHGKVTVWAQGLPATVAAQYGAGGTSAVEEK